MIKSPSREPSGTNTPAEALTRRGAAGAFLALGAATLAGCMTDPGESVATQEESLSGPDVKWVDTVLGAAPPAARIGDLATKTNVTLGATVAFAKGCVTPGDGGGGVFFWDTSTRTDDGGTVIVPNGTVGSTGPCWRRLDR